MPLMITIYDVIPDYVPPAELEVNLDEILTMEIDKKVIRMYLAEVAARLISEKEGGGGKLK